MALPGTAVSRLNCLHFNIDSFLQSEERLTKGEDREGFGTQDLVAFERTLHAKEVHIATVVGTRWTGRGDFRSVSAGVSPGCRGQRGAQGLVRSIRGWYK